MDLKIVPFGLSRIGSFVGIFKCLACPDKDTGKDREGGLAPCGFQSPQQPADFLARGQVYIVIDANPIARRSLGPPVLDRDDKATVGIIAVIAIESSVSVVKKFKSLGLTHFSAYWAWQVALDEALEEAPLTPEYSKRRYRGKELLGAIDANGPEAAAWCFFAEESELGSDICNSTHVAKKLSQAERNRIKRLTKKEPKSKETSPVAEAQPNAAVTSVTAAKAPAAIPTDTVTPTFENCTHIDLEIDEAATLCDLDDVIYQHLASIAWNGSRRVEMRAYFNVPGQDVRQHYLFTVAPYDEDELIYELRKIDKWIAEPITYTIVEKAA